jgi:hypothetical protein
VSTLSEKRELYFEGGRTVLKKIKLSARQLSLPFQLDDPVPIPAERQQELEQVLADLLLSVARADAEEEGRELS